MRAYWLIGLVALGACAQSSPPMEMADGTYSIQARAAPVRGGSTGAYEVAHQNAMQFCAKSDKRAVIISGSDRDIYQSGGSLVVNQYGAAGGGSTMAAGAATLRFKCV